MKQRKFGTCSGCGTVTRDIHSRCGICAHLIIPGVDWGKHDGAGLSGMASRTGGVESDRGSRGLLR